MSSVSRILQQDANLRLEGQDYVLATIVDTAGSTYRKSGARMIIERSGDYIGLISGGCLEGDLQLRARSVFDTGRPEIVEYDMRAEDDLVWGLGLGCNGMIRILLEMVSHNIPHPVMTGLARSTNSCTPTRIAIMMPVRDSGNTSTAPSMVFSDGDPIALSSADMSTVEQDFCRELLAHNIEAPGVIQTAIDDAQVEVYLEEAAAPDHLLILGGGPDVLPLTEYVAALGWQVTVLDHRAAYANPGKFPHAKKVAQIEVSTALSEVEIETVSAAVLMSHHFPTDCSYLRQVLESRVPFIGLLGPRVRGQKLFEEINADWDAEGPRVHSPVGLDVGGETPEAIALSIAAELQSFATGRGGQPLRDRTSGIHD
jgi:xanthine dehydrogenase accessory factor